MKRWRAAWPAAGRASGAGLRGAQDALHRGRREEPPPQLPVPYATREAAHDLRRPGARAVRPGPVAQLAVQLAEGGLDLPQLARQAEVLCQSPRSL